MYFTDSVISMGKGSVSGEEITQQPRRLTAIYLRACQSVWWFYASLIVSLSLFERHINKEPATVNQKRICQAGSDKQCELSKFFSINHLHCCKEGDKILAGSRASDSPDSAG